MQKPGVLSPRKNSHHLQHTCIAESIRNPTERERERETERERERERGFRHAYERAAGLLELSKKGAKPTPQKFPVLEGHPAGRRYAEQAMETFEKERGATVKEYRVYRWSPDRPHHKPYLQSYFLDLTTCGPMVLDALQKIKAEDDSTLSYRGSCREGICGSCAMNIDGTNTVACLKPIDVDNSKPTTITPFPHMFVIKDLIVDPTNFYHKYKSIEPWLKTRHPLEDGREYRQTLAERKRLNGLYKCILCACCSSSCRSYWWSPEEFLGPAAHLHAYRWICDSQDEFADERLQALMEDQKRLYRCRTTKNCTNTCLKSLNPADAIHKIKARHLVSMPVEKAESR